MALGSRQNLFAFAVTGTAAGVSTTITVDRPFMVNRLKVVDDDGVLDLSAKIRIEAEGELLYSGLDLPIWALFIKTEDAAAATVAVGSPHVLQFDRPLVISKDYPLKITISNSTEVFYVVGEGA